MSEVRNKRRLLSDVLDRHTFDAAFLWTRPNFAWLTGGRDNHVGRATNVGVAGLLAFRDRIVCLCSSIEARRYREEELAGLDVDVIAFPWWDAEAARRTVRDLVAGSRVGCDQDQLALGWPSLPGEFLELRQTLCDEEISRYRTGATIARDAMEACATQLKPGMSEFEIAGLLEHEVRRRGASPTCVLIAADERLDKFRHPIPTEKKFTRVVMLVLGCEYRGLITSLSRIVHVGPISSDLQRRLQAVADIDATAIFATRPGRTIGHVFADIQSAYARAGFDGEWKFHHQGGLTAYAGREVLANPTVDRVVEKNQAYAWNPSVPGCKSEGTILVCEDGFEDLTPTACVFPEIKGRFDDREVTRPGILEI